MKNTFHCFLLTIFLISSYACQQSACDSFDKTALDLYRYMRRIKKFFAYTNDLIFLFMLIDAHKLDLIVYSNVFQFRMRGKLIRKVNYTAIYRN